MVRNWTSCSMACLHSNLNMTGQVHCPRTNRHRPTYIYSHELPVPKTVALSSLQTKRAHAWAEEIPHRLLCLLTSTSCILPHLMTHHHSNAMMTFKMFRKSPFPCAFRWSLQLLTAAHALHVKAEAPLVSPTAISQAHILCGQLPTLSESHWANPRMHSRGCQRHTAHQRHTAPCSRAPAAGKSHGKRNWW